MRPLSLTRGRTVNTRRGCSLHRGAVASLKTYDMSSSSSFSCLQFFSGYDYNIGSSSSLNRNSAMRDMYSRARAFSSNDSIDYVDMRALNEVSCDVDIFYSFISFALQFLLLIHTYPTRTILFLQKMISLAESGDIAKAEELLNQMQADAISHEEKDKLPDIDSYTALMNAFIDEQRRLMSTIEIETNEITSDMNATMPNTHCAESNEEGAVTIISLAEKTHELLILMEDLSGVSDHYSSMRLAGDIGTDLRNPSLQPTSHHYDTAISAFSNASIAAHDTHYTSHLIKNAPFIANRWLTRLETLSGVVTTFETLAAVTPTVDSYFHVMEAYVASDTTNGPNKQTKTPILVQSVFDRLKSNLGHPTVREYRLMMRTWATSNYSDAAYKAMGLWMTMQRSFRNEIEEMEPTLEDGKLVLDTWTKSKNKKAAQRAQTVLRTMENAHSAKRTTVQPDLDCYRSVLITMSRSRSPATGANIPKLFKSMENYRIDPDTMCFDAAIETLKECARLFKDREKAVKNSKAAEAMLQRMEQEHDRSNTTVIKPSGLTYTNVIRALVVQNTKKSAEKADKLLNTMVTAYEGGDESMRPTRDSYVGVISAYGNSGTRTNFINANEVLQRMLLDYTQNGNESAHPTISSFHAVIWACSNTTTTSPENQREALMLAISTMQQMKKTDGCHPSPRTYQLLLQCCTTLLPSGPESEKIFRSIFRSCCKDGLVDKKVLTEFQSAVSADAYHKEIVHDAPSYNGIKSLPETWTRSLGYRVRTHESCGIRTVKRNPTISISGEVLASTAYNDYRMRRRWSKKNQKLLQGGRM